MDKLEDTQGKYAKLYDNMNSKIIILQEVTKRVTDKYIDVQKEMLLRDIGTSDFQTARLQLMKDQKGEDLLTLWSEADRQYQVAVANLQLAEFDIRFYIACVNSGLY
jgi:hypothetical protein